MRLGSLSWRFCLCWRTYVGVESVAVKIPGAHELHFPAGVLRPGIAVDKRGVERECENTQSKENAHKQLTNHWLGGQTQALDTVCKEIDFLGERKNSKVKCRQVVMKE